MRRLIRPGTLLRPLAIAVSFILFCAGAAAEEASLKGVALVIGQSAYTGLAQLSNPVTDARALDDLLDALGFDVTRVLDADAEELSEEIADFAEDAAGADVAFIYYAGHGIEVGGENYLIPVDADISTPESAGEKLVPLTALLDELRATVPVTIFLLDACRTNSFPPGQLVQLPGQSAPVAVSPEGLGETRGDVLTTVDAASESLGVVIGFAAAPGRAALDGEPGGNSPYAAALLKHLGAADYGFGDVMTLVSEEVYLRTAARQQPWVNSSLRRILRFGSAAAEPADSDEALIRDGRRALLMTIATAPAATRAFVEETASEENVPLDALYGMLKALGVDTAGGDIEAQLTEGAQRLKAFMAERPTAAKSDAELIRLSDLADRAQVEGAIDVALRFREQASARADELSAALDSEEDRLRENRLELAATYAEHASTAEINFDYLTAAQKYADAFGQVERWDRDLAVQYKQWQADALSLAGYHSTDNEPLRRSVVAYEEALALAPREENPVAWGALQNNLSIVLTTLGNRSADTGYLEQAVQAIRASLEIYTREDYPVDWGVAQGNLGAVLAKLGARDVSPRRLEEAADAFRLSLEEKSPERDARTWVQAQVNLGSVLVMLSSRDGSESGFEEAIATFRLALGELDRDAYPLDWATTQDSLGSALKLLGGLRGDNAMLEEAIVAFRASIEARPRQRSPLDWAATQNNIGNTLVTLGEWQDDLAMLEDAEAAFRQALEEYRRDVSPLDWATLQNGLGNALYGKARLSDDTALYLEAAGAYRASIEERRGRVPLDWASTEENLGNALREVGFRTADPAVLAEAAIAYRNALTEWTRERSPSDWADLQYGLAWVLTGVGEYTQDPAPLREALIGYALALEEQTFEATPYAWTLTQNAMSAALQLLGVFEADPDLLQAAKEAVDNAWSGYRAFGLDNDAYFSGRIADLDAAIAGIEASQP